MAGGSADAIALRFPGLPDVDIPRAVRLADGYECLRGALLTVSGVELLTTVRPAEPGSLSGMLAAASEQLERGRAHLQAAAGAGYEPVRRRALALLGATGLLGDAVERLRRDPRVPAGTAVLHAVRDVLARTAVPDAGMHHISPVSCAHESMRSHG